MYPGTPSGIWRAPPSVREDGFLRRSELVSALTLAPWPTPAVCQGSCPAEAASSLLLLLLSHHFPPWGFPHPWGEIPAGLQGLLWDRIDPAPSLCLLLTHGGISQLPAASPDKGAAAWGRATHERGSPGRGSCRGRPSTREGSPYPACRLSMNPSVPSQGTEAPEGGGKDRGSTGSRDGGSKGKGVSRPGAAAEPGAALGRGCSTFRSFLLRLRQLFPAEIPCPQKARPGLAQSVSPQPGGPLPRKEGPWAGELELEGQEGPWPQAWCPSGGGSVAAERGPGWAGNGRCSLLLPKTGGPSRAPRGWALPRAKPCLGRVWGDAKRDTHLGLAVGPPGREDAQTQDGQQAEGAGQHDRAEAPSAQA